MFFSLKINNNKENADCKMPLSSSCKEEDYEHSLDIKQACSCHGSPKAIGVGTGHSSYWSPLRAMQRQQSLDPCHALATLSLRQAKSLNILEISSHPTCKEASASQRYPLCPRGNQNPRAAQPNSVFFELYK
jgi:hypothetical protein